MQNKRTKTKKEEKKKICAGVNQLHEGAQPAPLTTDARRIRRRT